MSTWLQLRRCSSVVAAGRWRCTRCTAVEAVDKPSEAADCRGSCYSEERKVGRPEVGFVLMK